MTTTIFISLIGEGADVWRPVTAEHVHDEVYRITGSPADDTETWQFIAGDIVRCREHTFSGGERGLVAYERVTVNAA